MRRKLALIITCSIPSLGNKLNFIKVNVTRELLNTIAITANDKYFLLTKILVRDSNFKMTDSKNESNFPLSLEKNVPVVSDFISPNRAIRTGKRKKDSNRLIESNNYHKRNLNYKFSHDATHGKHRNKRGNCC
ncbi:MAG: hypothetical protein IPG24_22165 [Leptospiraceae bacterium]|nr:hypothetical protein [Leptospiraceae bacterium]